MLTPRQPSGKPGCWVLQRGAATDAPPFAAAGTRLYGKGGADLPQSIAPFGLKGAYAIFVYAFGDVKLRLSGDERYDRLGASLPYREQLWKWARMDWQHVIVRQNYAFTSPAATSLDYVKLVPLTPELIAELESPFGKPDKIVATYWEPYSYAFSDNVHDVFWHREYLGAYRDADVSIADTQQGRFHYFDTAPYEDAVRGTRCVLLPQLDALSWGLAIPGLFLWRVARLRPRQSKGIFISPFNQLPGYHRWERLHVWLEGIPMGEVEIYLDDQRINHFDGPPYMVGSQGYDGDTAMPRGKHQLKIRARDGDGWLEQVFEIVSAG